MYIYMWIIYNYNLRPRGVGFHAFGFRASGIIASFGQQGFGVRE